jgi:hypothetical protein
MSQKNWNEVDLIFRGHHEPMSSAANRMGNALRERAMQKDAMNDEDNEQGSEAINATATSRPSTPQSVLKNALAAAQTLLSGLSGLAANDADDGSQPGSQVAFSDEM